MLPVVLGQRLDALIDDFIMDGGVEAASLASILLAAKDSVQSDFLVSLSRRIWEVNSELRANYAQEQARILQPGVDAVAASSCFRVN